MSKRRVCYLTGTRADFGLMARTLRLVHASAALELGVVVTGMHLSERYGLTVREIERERLPVIARITTQVDETSGTAMASAVGETLLGMVDALSAWRPDVMLLLGDRGEMLAGAVAATYVGVPIVHLHGGERSGTVDEAVRHAISKLGHYHFAATPGARERLIRMGERAERVFVTGAPGLDDLASFEPEEREALCRESSLDPARPVCLVVFHPVHQEQSQAGEQARVVVDGILAARAQALAMMPNADAGGERIREELAAYAGHRDVRVVTHLPRERYLSWLARADALVGNSSSGIIEAASVGQWVLNVGSRQQLRERSGNVVDVEADRALIAARLAELFARPRQTWQNVYGSGNAAERIVELLERLPLDPAALYKSNVY